MARQGALWQGLAGMAGHGAVWTGQAWRGRNGKGGQVKELEQYIPANPADVPRFAAKAVRELPKASLAAIVADRIEHLRREQVRAVARTVVTIEVVQSPQDENGPAAATVTVLTPEAKRLLPQYMALGDGISIRYGDATVEQFRQRRDLYVRQREGIDREITLLDGFIEVLTKTGARCLHELTAGAAG